MTTMASMTPTAFTGVAQARQLLPPVLRDWVGRLGGERRASRSGAMPGS
jgi:hypothetical protein